MYIVNVSDIIMMCILIVILVVISPFLIAGAIKNRKREKEFHDKMEKIARDLTEDKERMK